MKINGKTDIEAPLAFVLQVLADFHGLERAALRRGIDLRRTDSLAAPGVGASWTVQFRFRGMDRIIDLQVTDFDPAGRIATAFTGKAAQGTSTIVALALSPRRTRISASLDIRARTLAARLLFQSMRLARPRVVRRFEQRLALFGDEIETRFKATVG